jgi:hypothetical protein
MLAQNCKEKKEIELVSPSVSNKLGIKDGSIKSTSQARSLKRTDANANANAILTIFSQ